MFRNNQDYQTKLKVQGLQYDRGYWKRRMIFVVSISNELWGPMSIMLDGPYHLADIPGNYVAYWTQYISGVDGSDMIDIGGSLIDIGSGSVDGLMDLSDCETRGNGMRMGTMVILRSSGQNMELDRSMLNVWRYWISWVIFWEIWSTIQIYIFFHHCVGQLVGKWG